MVYDREFRWMLRAVWALLVLNGGLGIERAWHRDWATTIAYLIWFLNLCFWLRLMQRQQRMRDLMRLHEAAFMKVLEVAAGKHEDV